MTRAFPICRALTILGGSLECLGGAREWRVGVIRQSCLNECIAAFIEIKRLTSS